MGPGAGALSALRGMMAVVSLVVARLVAGRRRCGGVPPKGMGVVGVADRSLVPRRRSVGGRRPFRTVIKHSAEEKEWVEALAAAQGVSVPRLYERALFAADAVSAARLTQIHDEMLGVRRLVAGAASNVNQVAKVANATGGVSGVELGQLEVAHEALLRYLERLMGLLEGLPGGQPGRQGGSRPTGDQLEGDLPAGGEREDDEPEDDEELGADRPTEAGL